MQLLQANAHPRTIIRPLAYYKAMILVLVAGITAGFSHQTIAANLNERGITTVSGLEWNAGRVKSQLKKLKHHKVYRTHTHRALLELVYQGELSVAQTMPLFEQHI